MKYIDWVLLVFMVPLFLFSLVTLFSFSGTDTVFWHQLLWIIVSLSACLIVSQIDMSFLKKTRVIGWLYVLGIFLLLLVLLFGDTVKGAQSWINFGFFSFQPADVVKLFLIIVLSKYLSRRHIEIAHPKHIFVTAVYLLIPLGFIMLQPDFGSGMVLMAIWFFMLLISGISRKHLLVMVGLGVIAFLGLWLAVFKPYQKARIVNFIHPTSDIRGSGYNVYQSMIAVGSGKITGKGVGYGTQSRLNYLPENTTDFIYAAYAEEWGFIGVTIMIICFGGLLLRIMYYARHAVHNFEILFCVGVIIMLLVHIVVNIGMNTGIMPVTGIPLPLVSYGGSHILVECIAIGIIMGMRHHTRDAHRDQLQAEYYGDSFFE